MAEVLEKIRPVMVDLIGLDGARVAKLTIIVAGTDAPKIVMLNGDPFLIEETRRQLYERLGGAHCDGLIYQQVRPFRADLGF